MSDKSISQLPASTTPLAGTEELAIVQSGDTKKTTVADVTADKAPISSPTFSETVTVESASGAEIFISRDDTAIASGNLLGGVAFKGNDASGMPSPQYCGIKAYATGSGNNPDLEFYSGNGNYAARTPQFVIEAYTGDVTVNTGNLVIGTSGKGIDFSADGSAAGMTSELLDDYEEGTWTPALTGPTAQTYTSAGYYVKVGNVVLIQGYIDFTVAPTGGTNYRMILPFTPATNTDKDTNAISVHVNTASTTAEFLAFYDGSSTSYFRNSAGTGRIVEANWSTGKITFSGTFSLT